MVAGAGVVDEDVDAAVEGLERLVGHPGHLVVVGEVRGDGHELVAGPARLRRRLAVGLLAAAADRDPGPGLGEPEGERLPEALVAAGDEGGTPLQGERGAHGRGHLSLA